MQFGVHGVTGEGLATAVTGRCYVGPICVGDFFDHLISQDEASDPGQPIRLRVLRIEAYGQSLDELDTGLTARLYLSGDLPAQLADGWVLSSGGGGGLSSSERSEGDPTDGAPPEQDA